MDDWLDSINGYRHIKEFADLCEDTLKLRSYHNSNQYAEMMNHIRLLPAKTRCGRRKKRIRGLHFPRGRCMVSNHPFCFTGGSVMNSGRDQLNRIVRRRGFCSAALLAVWLLLNSLLTAAAAGNGGPDQKSVV